MTVSRRVERANELLREIIGDFLLHRLRDPRLEWVTVTEVQVSADFQKAKVFVSILKDNLKDQEVLTALEKAQPLIREEINRNVHWRFIPHLTFVVDRRMEKASYVLSLLDRLAQESAPKGRQQGTRRKRTAASPKATTDEAS
ncbi:MAG: 30S ribosome-binding factor RbfA [Armatimonadetes bacterium]|nr:30S ribosome-binding factor RbfA [Armatimonadota bacterium]MDW8122342.1 30S ribosome-binding factor RbfA [Armatimonadota bacterium]